MNSIVKRRDLNRFFPFICRLIKLIQKIVLFRLQKNFFCFFLRNQSKIVLSTEFHKLYFHVQMNGQNGDFRLVFILIDSPQSSSTAKQTHFSEANFSHIGTTIQNTHSSQIFPNRFSMKNETTTMNLLPLSTEKSKFLSKLEIFLKHIHSYISVPKRI